MSMTEHPSFALPTAADVTRWKLELDRVVSEESEMKARHAAEEKALRDRRTRLEKLVSAGAAFVEVTKSDADEPKSASAPTAQSLPSDGAPKPKKAPPARRNTQARRPRSRSRTWTATILRVLRSAGRGMTYSELKDEVAKTHLGETLSRTDRALYGGVAKLADRDEVVKRNGRLYTPSVYHKFMDDVAAGRAVEPPPPPTGNHGSPNKTAIFEFLATRPDGATTADIVDALYRSPPERLEISPNKTVIYNLLSKMRDKAELIHRDGRHHLPAQPNGTPGSEEPGVSTSHQDARGGALSSSGNGRPHPSVAHLGARPAQPGE